MENNQVLVISGETGCGKTTQVSDIIIKVYQRLPVLSWLIGHGMNDLPDLL